MHRAWALGFLLLLGCSACGYRFGGLDAPLSHYRTISIPYIDGDPDGMLTNVLIRKLSASSPWRYRVQGGDLQLCAKIVTCGQENVGYQFDRLRDPSEEASTNLENELFGEQRRRLLPNLARYSLGIEVTLRDCRSRKILLGPKCILTELEYDFDPLTTDTRLAVFSLGQFTNVDEAYDAARLALYNRFAQKVVDLLLNSCL